MHVASVMTMALCLAGLPFGTVLRAADGAAPVGWRGDSLRINDNWNTFTADMRITRQHVKRNGTPIGAVIPDARYRIERSNRSGRWKTVTTVLAIDQPTPVAADGAAATPPPIVVHHLEDDEDGTALRAYGAGGQRLGLFKDPLAPAGAASSSPVPSAPRLNGREWITRLVAARAETKDRMNAFDRAYGTPANAGGVSVYTRTIGDVTKRIVVDTANGVPTEYTETRSGVPTVRVSLRYGPAGADGVVRLGMRSEVSVSPEVDDVVIVDASYSNIALARR